MDKMNLYLIYRYYDIRKTDTANDVIFECARKSYREFWRRVVLKNKVSIDQKNDIEQEIENLLCCRIPALLETKSQKEFDEQHNEICLEILQCYKNVGNVAYGIAQRWLNQTLLNLVIIESNLKTKYWDIDGARKWFHVPVDNTTIEAATSKNADRFLNGLNLQCAPLKHELGENVNTSCFRLGKMQPFELWTYEEYINFQKELRESIKGKEYKDTVEWFLSVMLEGR